MSRRTQSSFAPAVRFVDTTEGICLHHPRESNAGFAFRRPRLHFVHDVGKSPRPLPFAGGRIRTVVPAAAADATTVDHAGQSHAYDDHGERNSTACLPFEKGRCRRRGDNERAVAYANGMFILMRAVSVLSTSADFAMWRLRFALFDESK